MNALELVAVMLLCGADPEPPINPVPRTVLSEAICRWDFDRDDEGWAAQHNCVLSAAGGSLKINATGDDPYLHRPLDLPGGHVLFEIRARSTTGGNGGIYWTTDLSPHRGEDKAKGFALEHDNQWHEYSVPLAAPGVLTDLRIDPGQTAGRFEVDWIRLVRQKLHPLTIEHVKVDGRRVGFVVRNHRAEPVVFEASGKTSTVGAGATLDVTRPLPGESPLEAVSIELNVVDYPPLRRTVFLHHPELETDWIELPMNDFALQVAADGSMARVKQDGQLVALLGPLVHRDGKIPALELVSRRPQLRFQGEGITVNVSTDGNELSVSIDTADTAGPCEGPVVRAVGRLEQGLLAGLEYLSRDEKSSSKLDVETEEHLRFAPDPLKVTMPLMSFVTDRASVAMTWDDMQLQPVYATPNFFDSTADHRMSLRGRRIETTIRVDRAPLEETIAWAVGRHGLPPLPEAPRTKQSQWDLCLKGLNGPIKSDEGWGHCVESKFPRHPYSDMASTVWRLTGQMPEFPRVVPGGAHIDNHSIYFVTGQAAQWKAIQEDRVRGLINRQLSDGSFRYDGKYRRGHFENTASGVCARPANTLLEYAQFTGDKSALAAGVKALEYMKRFRTPRGAQVWEVPLHTPDQLASAYLVMAYVRGFELTGDRQYLAEARRWGLSGVPFVYLWSQHPVMLYATPPVYGATNWLAPCWLGKPVQWVGIVYAYSLTMLDKYDDSLDWNHLARGILIAAEQMQYTDGDYVGLLPDAFELAGQQPRPWTINPCAMVSLRLAVDGCIDSLSTASDGDRRVVAPYPALLRDGQAHIEGRQGVKYQVLIDGTKIVDVTSVGNDVISLD